jgi:hypothetical protein
MCTRQGIARIVLIIKFCHIDGDRHHRETHSGVYGTTQASDRLERTNLIITLHRIRWVCDQVLALTYMAFYGRITGVDRGH